MDINEWTEIECGVTVINNTPQSSDTFFWQGKLRHDYKWNYKDPRCMIIIRDKFGMETGMNGNRTKWHTFVDGKFYPKKNTPHEAETACIEAIYATEDR